MGAKQIPGFIVFISLLLGGLIAAKLDRGPVCANTLSCNDLSERVENGALGIFNGQAIIPPEIDLAALPTANQILGETSFTGDKNIFINLTTQTLTAKQGETVFLETPVSTGKWNRTPTGDFKIWSKFRATRMSGGQGNDYYNLPNVPFTMFFSGSGIAPGLGFALHGAYWHNNFGHPMSHGCVNMRPIDAEKIFYWVDDSTTITIYGQAPL